MVVIGDATGTTSIGTSTPAITETSELVNTFSMTVDVNPNTYTNTVNVVLQIELVYDNFTTPPVIN